MLADPNRCRQLRQPIGDPRDRCAGQRLERLCPFPNVGVIRPLCRPFVQLGIELEKPRQPVRSLEGDAARSSQVAHLRSDVRRGDALVECRSRAAGKRGVSVEARDARQEPVAVHGRMPVVAAVERGRQLARRPHVGIAVQHVGDLVGYSLCTQASANSADRLNQGGVAAEDGCVGLARRRSASGRIMLR